MAPAAVKETLVRQAGLWGWGLTATPGAPVSRARGHAGDGIAPLRTLRKTPPAWTSLLKPTREETVSSVPPRTADHEDPLQRARWVAGTPPAWVKSQIGRASC